MSYEESNDQPWQESNQDQPMYEVNGQQFTAEQLVSNYKSLQKDYTQKSQKISEYEKLGKPVELETSDDDKHIDDYLTKKGFIKKEDFEKFTKRQSAEWDFREIMDNNPHLRPYEKAIRDISKTSDMAYEDIITEYNFCDAEKIRKGRSRDPMGEPYSPERKTNHSVTDMPEKEWQALKADIRAKSGGSSNLSKSKSLR